MHAFQTGKATNLVQLGHEPDEFPLDDLFSSPVEFLRSTLGQESLIILSPLTRTSLHNNTDCSTLALHYNLDPLLLSSFSLLTR